MININQSSSFKNEADTKKYCSMLLKQLYKFKSNSKFGIYLSKIEDEEMITYSVLDRPSTESDFVNNPELLMEFLPQPYRYVSYMLFMKIP